MAAVSLKFERQLYCIQLGGLLFNIPIHAQYYLRLKSFSFFKTKKVIKFILSAIAPSAMPAKTPIKHFCCRWFLRAKLRLDARKSLPPNTISIFAGNRLKYLTESFIILLNFSWLCYIAILQ